MTDYVAEGYAMITVPCPECGVLLRIAEDRRLLECQNHHCGNDFVYWRPLTILYPLPRDRVDDA